MRTTERVVRPDGSVSTRSRAASAGVPSRRAAAAAPLAAPADAAAEEAAVTEAIRRSQAEVAAEEDAALAAALAASMSPGAARGARAECVCDRSSERGVDCSETSSDEHRGPRLRLVLPAHFVPDAHSRA